MNPLTTICLYTLIIVIMTLLCVAFIEKTSNRVSAYYVKDLFDTLAALQKIYPDSYEITYNLVNDEIRIVHKDLSVTSITNGGFIEMTDSKILTVELMRVKRGAEFRKFRRWFSAAIKSEHIKKVS